MAGSCLEYDWTFGYCSETTPCHPHTTYGVAKHALQLLAMAQAASAGFSSAWGRVFFLYGPYEHPDRLMPAVIRALLKGEPARCSHGRQIRDYLFVQDVADAFVALLGRDDVTGPINIASGEAVTVRTLVGEAATLIGRPDLVQFGAIPAAPTDVPLVVADVSRATAALGWRPAVSLTDGVARTVAWWSRQLANEAGGRR